MASQTLFPDGLLASSGFSACVLGSLTARDAAWCVASSVDANTDVHVSFPTPPGALVAGAGLQVIELQLRKFNSNSNHPAGRIQIWEAGGGAALLSGPDVTISSTTGQIITLAFDAAILAQLSGANLEVKASGIRSNGSPAQRTAVDIGEVRWIANYTAGAAPALVLAGRGA